MRIPTFFLSIALLSLPTIGLAIDCGGYFGQLLGLKQSTSNLGKQFIDFRGSKVAVPLGLEPQYFKSFLDELFSQKEVQSAVFWGSRTHFSHGYLPQKGSDLDFDYFAPMYGNRQISPLTSRLIDASKKKFSDSQGIPLAESLGRWEHGPLFRLIEIKYGFAAPPSLSKEIDLFTLGGKLSPNEPNARGYFTKKKILEEFKRRYPDQGIFINREALIFIRAGREAQEIFSILKERGFENIYILPN